MPRQKLEPDFARAFARGVPSRKYRNTQCDGDTVWLHGHAIAWRDENGAAILCMCGWPTPTTRDRLNSICAALGLSERFSQCDFAQYFGEREVGAHEWLYVEGPLAALARQAERRNSVYAPNLPTVVSSAPHEHSNG